MIYWILGFLFVVFLISSGLFYLFATHVFRKSDQTLIQGFVVSPALNYGLLWKAAVATVIAYFVIWCTIVGWARLYYYPSLDVVGDVIQEMNTRPVTELRDDLERRLGANFKADDPVLRLFVERLCGEKDPQFLAQAGVRDVLTAMLNRDPGKRRDVQQGEWLTKLVKRDDSGGSGQPSETNVDKSILEATTAHLKEGLVPHLGVWESKPRSARDTLSSLPSQFSVKAQLVDTAGLKLAEGYLAHMSKAMDPFFRGLSIVLGLIQVATVMLYFWGVGMLTTRWGILKAQHAHNVLLPKEGEEGPYPKTEVIDSKIVLSEQTRISSHFKESVVASSFVLSLVQGVWKALSQAASLDSDARNRAAEVVRESCRSTDERLAKVEYHLVDYVIWGMPTLGFIGTVVGIGLALSDLDQVVRASEQADQALAIRNITATLAFAFDTTLVALMCGLPIMYCVSVLRARESQFLLEVERRISDSILQRICLASSTAEATRPSEQSAAGRG